MNYILIFAFLLFSFNHTSSKSLNSKSLKILYLLYSFPRITQTFIFENIAAMVDRGHEIDIFALRRADYTQHQPIIDQYNLFEKTSFGEFSKPLDSYDIIFFQYGDLIFHLSYLLQGKLSAKTVICIRGADFTRNYHSKKNQYKTLFKKADLFLPVCEYFKNKLEYAGCPKKKIIVYSSSIDCSAFPYKQRFLKKDKERIELISVGRLTPKKGRETLLKAMTILKEKYDIHLTIVGNGRQRFFLKNYVRLLGLQKNVTFVYEAVQSGIRSYLERAHIFILASETTSDGDEEGIPNALKEAMASGVPVIATNHGGNTELIIHGETGLLVPEKDPKEIADAVIYLVENYSALNQMTEKARNISELYDRNNLAQKLEKLFFHLLEN